MCSLQRDRKRPWGRAEAQGRFLVSARHVWAAEQRPWGPRHSLGKPRLKCCPAPALPGLCLQEGAINHAPGWAGLCSSPCASPSPTHTPQPPLHLYNQRQHRLHQPHLQRGRRSDPGPRCPHHHSHAPATNPLGCGRQTPRGTRTLPSPSPPGRRGSPAPPVLGCRVSRAGHAERAEDAMNF